MKKIVSRIFLFDRQLLFNLLVYDYRTHSSNIPSGRRSESNPHSPAGHCRWGSPVPSAAPWSRPVHPQPRYSQWKFFSHRIQKIRTLLLLEKSSDFVVVVHLQGLEPWAHWLRETNVQQSSISAVTQIRCFYCFIANLCFASAASVIQPFRCAKSVQKCAEPKSAS